MLKIDHIFATVARNEVARFDLILALCLLIVPCLPYSWWQGRNLFDKCCHSSSLFHCLITGMDIGQACANSHIDSVQLYGKTCFYNFGNFKQHFQRLACFVQISHSFSSITCSAGPNQPYLALQVNHAGCSFLPGSSLRLRHGNPLPPEDRSVGQEWQWYYNHDDNNYDIDNDIWDGEGRERKRRMTMRRRAKSVPNDAVMRWIRWRTVL